jgi:ketosteroid isomerase-like protein
MQRFVHVLALASALACSAPALAEQLTETALKAFSAKIDAAISRRDVETIVAHIAEHAVISGTALVQGQMQTFRMNKSQYRQMLTATWSVASSYEYGRSNERVTIDGDQAVITADIAETMVIQGQQISTKARERATVESIDGRLLLTQMVANQVL